MNWKFASLTVLVIIATVVTLLFGTAVATAYAAQGALPGGALYSVKTGLERAQLTLSSDAALETRLHLTFAEKRLDELAAVIERGRTEDAASLVEQFETHIEAAIESLSAVAASDPIEAQELTGEVIEALSRYSQILGELYAIVPDTMQSAVARAQEASQLGSHLPEMDLLGTVASIGDPIPQNGEAIWEIDLLDGGGIVPIIVTEQTSVADGVVVGDLVEVEAFIIDSTFVAHEIHPAEDEDDGNENANENANENLNENENQNLNENENANENENENLNENENANENENENLNENENANENENENLNENENANENENENENENNNENENDNENENNNENKNENENGNS